MFDGQENPLIGTTPIKHHFLGAIEGYANCQGLCLTHRISSKLLPSSEFSKLGQEIKALRGVIRQIMIRDHGAAAQRMYVQAFSCVSSASGHRRDKIRK